jgi:hypothetical protein
MSHEDKKQGLLQPQGRLWRRRLIAIAILAVVLAVIAIVGGKLLAPYAVSQIEAYTGTVVTVESAKFTLTGTLRLRELKMVSSGPEGSVILQANKVSAGFGLFSILKGSPQLKSLSVSGGVLNLEYDAQSGKWNLSSLLQKSHPTSSQLGALPQTQISDCMVTLIKKDGSRRISMLAVPLVFDASTISGRGYKFHMTSKLPGSRLRHAADPWDMDVRGEISNIGSTGDFALEIGMKNLILSNERVRGEMRVGRELAEILHEELVRLWDKYTPDGNIDVQANISGSMADISKGQVTATFSFKDVSLKYKYFPYLLEHVKGSIFFQNGDLVMEGLTGRHGPTLVSISGWSRGSGKAWASDVTIHSDVAIIDEDVYMALSPAEKGIWRMFSPSGRTQFDFQYKSEQGKELVSRATLTVIDGQMMYERFWHRFTKGTGTLIVEPNEVRLVGVTSREPNDCVTTFNGAVSNIRTGSPEVDLHVSGRGMPVSTKLLAQCAPEQWRKQLGNIEFAGKMDFELTAFSVQKPNWHIDYVADANVRAPALKYIPGDIELAQPSGRVRLTSERLSLNGVSARYADSDVNINGQVDITDDPNTPMCYRMTVDADNVNIDRKVLSILPGRNARIIEELKPSGRAHIIAGLGNCNKVAEETLAIECLGTQAHIGKLGYTLADMTGKVTVKGGAIGFDNLKANVVDPQDGQSGTTSISGTMLVGKDKVEELNIKFEADGLHFGQGLRQAVERMSPDLYDALNPAGRIGLKQGSFKMGVDPNGQRFGDFGGTMVFENCSFGHDELSNVNATLSLNGFFDREMQHSNVMADLRAPTIVIRNKLVTDVRSHIEHRKGEKKWSLGNFSGTCYDGTVDGDVVLDSASDGGYTYSLKTSFENVNMGKFLARQGKDPNTTSGGIMKGTLTLSGNLAVPGSRTGSLTLNIEDMQVGRMSILAKIFTLLSLSVPSDIAFRGMQMNSRIKGDNILIDDLVMSGDALNFRGAGTINLGTRMVDIDLAATSPTPAPGLLTSVMVGLRHAVVYLKVRGKLDDPTVDVTPLPLVDRAIQKILGTRE